LEQAKGTKSVFFSKMGKNETALSKKFVQNISKVYRKGSIKEKFWKEVIRLGSLHYLIRS
jgi:hypothetical protein